jgi:hypothetical protein
MTPISPRWSDSQIDQRLSFRPGLNRRDSRLDRRGKSPTIPGISDAAIPIFPICPAELEQSFEMLGVAAAVTNGMIDDGDVTDLVEAIVLSFLRCQTVATNDDSVAPSEPNRELVQFVR